MDPRVYPKSKERARWGATDDRKCIIRNIGLVR